ncbi:unnamed protein product [Oikopleura dioica]|uniref:Uncharacterized protein n=1 Tax=Oikopleura dioica TaxID=34765 RepID=E4X1B5_OIKDI|nr:unnamed protein product [Oikopleura dioica]
MRILIILKIVFLTAGKKESLRNSHEILAQAYEPMINEEGRLDLTNPYARLYRHLDMTVILEFDDVHCRIKRDDFFQMSLQSVSYCQKNDHILPKIIVLFLSTHIHIDNHSIKFI